MVSTKWNPYTTYKLRVAYSGADLEKDVLNHLGNKFQIFSSPDCHQFSDYLRNQSLISLPEIILIEVDTQEFCFDVIENIKKSPLLKSLIIVLIAAKTSESLQQKIRNLKIHDFYVKPFSYDELAERLEFLVRFKLIKPSLTELAQKVTPTYKMPFGKRVFDILLSITCILFLLPVFLIVAGTIAIESDGKIIYKSKRVGTGYQIFNFYKFRSMRSNADKQLVNFSNLNQYSDSDNNTGKSVFVKLKNDPRVTRIGAFIRKTSIDELPQLFNILKGDMSFVGNRPLPLYEAEQLTSNEWATRFLGPAGLTGLWQISKRGREDMSERERKKLDNFYARNHSFWFDFRIIMRTFPALFQKEKV